MMRRQSGVVVPLFSLASRNGWGIGEFGDLPLFARWLMEAGQSIVQILPIHEMPPIETSPYSAMTAMALDPIYITMANVADFSGLGAEYALDGAEQAEVKRLKQSARVEHSSVRRLKDRWLRRSFDRFLRLEVSPRNAARREIRRICRRAIVVARRVRAVPRDQRDARNVPVDGVARAAGAGGGARDRRGTQRTAAGDHLPVVPAMDRRRSMVGSEAAVVAGAGVRRFTVHDLREQPRRPGRARTSSASTRRSACRLTHSAKPDRIGACRPGAPA